MRVRTPGSGRRKIPIRPRGLARRPDGSGVFPESLGFSGVAQVGHSAGPCAIGASLSAGEKGESLLRVALVIPGNLDLKRSQIYSSMLGPPPPLGVACIAAEVREAGHQVLVIDQFSEQSGVDDVAFRIAGFEPDAFGDSGRSGKRDPGRSENLRRKQSVDPSLFHHSRGLLEGFAAGTFVSSQEESRRQATNRNHADFCNL
ncbi:MAG: hypothetical protein ACI8TX_000506 [Hyphomicrobiaceae bacterium]